MYYSSWYSLLTPTGKGSIYMYYLLALHDVHATKLGVLIWIYITKEIITSQ